MRLELLNQFGGVYADIDYECFKSLDYLCHCYDFYVGITNERVYNLLNAFMASAPGHPTIKACVENIKKVSGAGAINNIIFMAGPAYITKIIMQRFYADPTDRTMIFPTSYFYPYPHPNLAKEQPWHTFVKPESYGIHYWDGSWVDQALGRKRKRKKRR